MDFNDKKLYHQIHPVKLLTDWITGAASLYLLWFHHLAAALIVMFVPLIVVSVVIIKFMDLRKLKNSSFGRYIQGFMTTGVEIVRFAGFAIMILGAWFNVIGLLICGLVIILVGWLRGIVFKKEY